MAKSLRVIKGKPVAQRLPKKDLEDAKTLTLDEIEQKMINLATDPTKDIAEIMANETKMNMLQKVADLKIKRLMVKDLEKPQNKEIPEPITVRFVSSDTPEQKERLALIDKSITENRTGKEDA